MNNSVKLRTSGKIAAALVLTAALFGAGAGAANAYTFPASLSVVSNHLTIGGPALNVQINNFAAGDVATFNGHSLATAQPNFSAPSKTGKYSLVLTVNGTKTQSVTVYVARQLDSISATVPSSVTHNKQFKVVGYVSPAVGGVKVNLAAASSGAGFTSKGTVTTSSSGKYTFWLKLAHKASYSIRVSVTGSSTTYTSVSHTTGTFAVK